MFQQLYSPDNEGQPMTNFIQSDRAGSYPTLLRAIAALTLAGLLAACGGGGSPAVRSGPQAVHPSNSFLANGVYIAVEGDQIAPVATCYDASIGCQTTETQYYTPNQNDGSTPILD